MSGSEGAGGSVVIFAGLAWYEERPEPEDELDGLVEGTPTRGGPADRAALSYTLHVGDSHHRVYAAGVNDRLAPLDGDHVRVRGRLVDLRDEGGVVELWIGTITPLPP